MQIDQTTIAIVSGWLTQIAEEMDEVICRTAFSPAISEGYDRASGLYSTTGELIAQGSTGLPAFVALMAEAVNYMIEEVAKKGEEFFPGDIYITNDPYHGGSHLMDTKLIKPFFRQGKPICFLGLTAHWADIGGSAASGYAGKAVHIFQEGLIIPVTKIYDKGKLQEDILRLILTNVRMPEERLGDFKAQVGALAIGEERLTRLFDKYGEDSMLACIGEMANKAERHMRSCIAEVPDGRYSATRYLDNDGVEDVPIRISVDIEIIGSDICFDYSRSGPPVRGPLNICADFAKSVAFVALKHIFPDLPINGGILRPVKVIVPENSVLHATFPRPVAGMVMTVTTLGNAIFSAFSQAMPEKLWADSFTPNSNLGIGGVDPVTGAPYVMFTFHGGGLGGYSEGDGITNGVMCVGISKSQPLEVLETFYPVRFLKFAVNEGSAGLGKYRGGFGADLEMEFLGEEATVNFIGDQGKFGSMGMLGGKEGMKTEVYIIRKNGERYDFPFLTKGESFLRKGDRIVLKTPGGGGYGDPRERDRMSILKDVVNGYIDKETSEREYGVTITEEDLEWCRANLL